MHDKKRALLIDDDEDFRATIGELLAREGFEVTEASSGRQGLELLADVGPDLVVLDVMMESPFEGYGVNQAIRFQPRYEAHRDVPIVMVSSVEQTPDDRFLRTAEMGMVRPDSYFTKPLDVPLFLQTVRRLTTPARVL